MSTTEIVDQSMAIVFKGDEKYNSKRWNEWFGGQALDYSTGWIEAMYWLKILQAGGLEKSIERVDQSLGIVSRSWLELIQKNAEQVLGLADNETLLANFTELYGEPDDRLLNVGAGEVYAELRSRTEQAMQLTFENSRKMFQSLMSLRRIVRSRLKALIQEREQLKIKLDSAKAELIKMDGQRVMDLLHVAEVNLVRHRLNQQIADSENRYGAVQQLINGHSQELHQLRQMIEPLVPLTRYRPASRLRPERAIPVVGKQAA